MSLLKRRASPDEKWEAIRETVRAWREAPTAAYCYLDRGGLYPCLLPREHEGECLEIAPIAVWGRVLKLAGEWHSKPAAAFCVRDEMCLRTLGHEGRCWPAFNERPRL